MKLYSLLIAFVAAMGGLLFGFDTAVISGVIEFIEKPEVFDLSAAWKGFTTGCIIIGCIAGAIMAGNISQRLGRKVSLMFAAFLFFISALGCGLANNLEVFIIFRVVGGLGVGIASILSPLYISEVAPAKYRGLLVSMNQLTIVLGILIAYFSNYALIDVNHNWRWMIGVMALPAGLFALFLLFVPESPRWLVGKSKDEEAEKTLLKINGSAEIAKSEMNQIKKSMGNQKEETRLMDLFNVKYRALVLIAIVLAVLQQASGINSIMYYAPAIFSKIGLSEKHAFLQTIIVGATNVVFTVVAMLFVDKLGRKPLMIIGLIGMTACHGLLAYAMNNEHINAYLVLGLILGFIAFFASSIGPIMWVVISEIMPNKIRSLGISVAVMFLWITNLIITWLFPIILESFGGSGAFLLFAILCGSMMVFVIFKIPETKGKSLEEIERDLVVH